MNAVEFPETAILKIAMMSERKWRQGERALRDELGTSGKCFIISNI